MTHKFVLRLFLLLAGTAFIITNDLKSQLLTEKMSADKNYWEIKSEIAELMEKGGERAFSPVDMKRYQRWCWFWNTRMDSSGSFYNSMNNYQQALEKYNLEEVEKQRLKSLTAPSLSWECLGPFQNTSSLDDGGQIGRLECVWADPDDPDIILTGSSTGGLWKTTNGGASWTCIIPSTISSSAMDIAVDPDDTDIIYVATGLHTNGYPSAHYSNGILKSTNGGSSWQYKNSGINETDKYFLHKIKMHPGNSSILYALADEFIYKSTNGGEYWTKLSLTTNSTNPFRYFVFDRDNPDTVFVSGYNRLYKSTNGGSTWTDIRNPYTFPANSRLAIEYYNNTLYVLQHYYSTTPTYTYLWSSPGGNGTYTRNTNWTNNTGRHFVLIIEISANGVMYFGGYNIYKSSPPYTTFTLQNNIHPDIRDICFANNRNDSVVFVAHDGGISKPETPLSNDYVCINGNISVAQFYGTAITELNRNVMLGGTHDCGTLRLNDGTSWSHVEDGDGGTTLFDYSDTSIAFCEFNSPKPQLRRSTDAGKTFSSTPVVDTIFHYNSPVVQDPNNPDVMYVGAAYTGNKALLLRSGNKGISFPDSLNNYTSDYGPITSIAVAPSDSNRIYYSICSLNGSNYPKVRKTTNWGVDWSDVTSLGFYEPITDIAIHPSYPNQLWVSLGGFRSQRVYYSSNSGSSWSNVSTGLPAVPVNCLEYDSETNTLIAGTDLGVYYYTGSTWSKLGQDMPACIITEIKINYHSRELIASSYGRGMYRISLPECYDPSNPTGISSSQTWTTDQDLCGDLVIHSHNTLTIQSTVTMEFPAKITVYGLATLVVDGGTIENANIEVKDYGTLRLINDGLLKLDYNDELDISDNATFELTNGELQHPDF